MATGHHGRDGKESSPVHDELGSRSSRRDYLYPRLDDEVTLSLPGNPSRGGRFWDFIFSLHAPGPIPQTSTAVEPGPFYAT